jgi:hypothetical protein
MTSQGAAVDLKAPTAPSPARAATVGIAEGKMAVLAGAAVAAGVGTARNDQRTAGADLDGQVQRAVSVRRRTRPGLRHTGQGGVIAEQDREVVWRADPLQVYRLPPEAGCLDQTAIDHGACHRHSDRNHATGMAYNKLTDRRPHCLGDGLRIASQVTVTHGHGASAVEPGHSTPPILVAQVDSDHDGAPGIGSQDAGGPTTSRARCTMLDEPPRRAQPRSDLGGRSAGQAQPAGELHPGQTRRTAKLAEHLRTRAPPIDARPTLSR